MFGRNQKPQFKCLGIGAELWLKDPNLDKLSGVSWGFGGTHGFSWRSVFRWIFSIKLKFWAKWLAMTAATYPEQEKRWVWRSSTRTGSFYFPKTNRSFVPVLQRRCHQIVRALHLPHPSHYWNEINGNSMKTATQAGEQQVDIEKKGREKTGCGCRSWQGGELGQLPFLSKCQEYSTT